MQPLSPSVGLGVVLSPHPPAKTRCEAVWGSLCFLTFSSALFKSPFLFPLTSVSLSLNQVPSVIVLPEARWCRWPCPVLLPSGASPGRLGSGGRAWSSAYFPGDWLSSAGDPVLWSVGLSGVFQNLKVFYCCHSLCMCISSMWALGATD